MPIRGPCKRRVFDRFIPYRPFLDVDKSHAKLSCPLPECFGDTPRQYRPNNSAYLKLLAETFGVNDEERILPILSKPTGVERSSPGGTSYKSPASPSTVPKTKRRVPSSPDNVMDMPGIRDDFYTNLLDWGNQNLVAVALCQSTYAWNADTKVCHRIDHKQTPADDFYLSSLAWNPGGRYLAIADSSGGLTVCHADTMKVKYSDSKASSGSIGAITWLEYGNSDSCIMYGNSAGQLNIHDLRCHNNHKCQQLVGHDKDVAGLALRSGYIASGGDDGVVNIWDIRMKDVYTRIEAHTACARALAWCPWRPSVIATGGGSNDGFIRLWHIPTGKKITEVDTKSQVCSMFWSNQYKELVTSHGSLKPEKNDIVIWDMSSLQFEPIIPLRHHLARPLHLALSPDQTTFASAGADEALCLWKSFPRKDVEHKSVTPRSPLDMATQIR